MPRRYTGIFPESCIFVFRTGQGQQRLGTGSWEEAGLTDPKEPGRAEIAFAQEARNTVSELREALADEKALPWASSLFRGPSPRILMCRQVKLAHAVGACTEEKEDKRACRDSLLVELATAQA